MMPKWLQGMVAPTLMLWLCLVAFGIVRGISPADEEIPGRAEIAARLLFPLVIAWWVIADARKRSRQLCYDYGSFVFFAAPFITPVYLFQTRGVRAFLTLLCFAGLCLTAGLVTLAVAAIRGGLANP